MSATSGRLAVDVKDVHKSFRLPLQSATTLKERVVHPFRREQYEELRVIRGVSFQVERGEFFGIAGRNASGKSTLLKLIASIYRVDSGAISLAGSVAPVIELGVGFQGQLSARENVILNALMMGLTPREAKRRFDAVIEYAELQDYVHMKLMNYSSGMRARLAFAIAMQTEPDVLLLDEVLAVGDPPFQKRCEAAFDEIKREGRKTVILVTHSMAQMGKYCDRAMLIEAGRIKTLGDPGEVGRRYEHLQVAALQPKRSLAPPPAPAPVPGYRPSPGEVVTLRLVDDEGRSVDRIEREDSIRVQAAVRAGVPLEVPRLGLRMIDHAGAPVFVPPPIDLTPYSELLTAGEPVEVSVEIENKLAAGSYGIAVVLASGRPGEDETQVSKMRVAHFQVPDDGRLVSGVADLDYDFRIRSGEATSVGREGRSRS